MSSPALTWSQLAETLDVADLVAAAEWAITVNAFERRLPIAALEDLVFSSATMAGSRGHLRREKALYLARAGALSRPESLLRFVLVSAGIPDPRINENCNDARGSFLALADLSWPEYRVAVEYEGDHHRGVAQFRNDIHRFERLADHGWASIRVSADDLFDRTGETVSRVASRLAERGWRGSASGTVPRIRR